MVANPKKYQAELAAPIEKVARLIRSFNRQEKAMLLQTVAEFFALPETEQDQLWQEAHLIAEQKMNNY
ncbi:MAG: hypothetical protein JW953_20365 [Anaerolineae bacterium]|nr:hypothetical protein [Anaerolineae bacterium]